MDISRVPAAVAGVPPGSCEPAVTGVPIVA